MADAANDNTERDGKRCSTCGWPEALLELEGGSPFECCVVADQIDWSDPVAVTAFMSRYGCRRGA